MASEEGTCGSRSDHSDESEDFGLIPGPGDDGASCSLASAARRQMCPIGSFQFHGEEFDALEEQEAGRLYRQTCTGTMRMLDPLLSRSIDASTCHDGRHVTTPRGISWRRLGQLATPRTSGGHEEGVGTEQKWLRTLRKTTTTSSTTGTTAAAVARAPTQAVVASSRARSASPSANMTRMTIQSGVTRALSPCRLRVAGNPVRGKEHDEGAQQCESNVSVTVQSSVTRALSPCRLQVAGNPARSKEHNEGVQQCEQNVAVLHSDFPLPSAQQEQQSRAQAAVATARHASPPVSRNRPANVSRQPRRSDNPPSLHTLRRAQGVGTCQRLSLGRC
eukprot:gnl/TRDRNA2_/TRDRNA2_139621_c0_seq1.p1 gnl/TRDRNA2_/TRDRNA2_139621_c0~~gnl/TRDRNA2_/TRDRNA2_139621_c0_seq1.p1  ORF type:complete len:353 (+),score=20.40 gnl/TRDRNA2_/TRDRNA2_139621_c0_seq1:63-1061(+)